MKPSPGFVADGHAHIYPGFDLRRWFEAGVAAAQHHGCPLVLFLTESTGCHYFAALRDRSPGAPEARPRGASLPGISDLDLQGFRVSPTTEDCSLAVSVTEAPKPLLFMVAGRQYVSRDGLEVLALGLPLASPLTHLEGPKRVSPGAHRASARGGCRRRAPMGLREVDGQAAP